MYFKIVPRSGTTKLGGVASCYAPRQTCPPGCPLLISKQCYGESVRIAPHWDALDGERLPSHVTYDELLDALPYLVLQSPNRIFRYAVVGELPGGDRVDEEAALRLLIKCSALLAQLLLYSHRRDEGTLALALLARERLGLALNVSADSYAEAGRLFQAGIPTVVITDHPPGTTWKSMKRKSEGGLPIIPCLAEWTDATCATCGNGRPLCARPDRKYAVGFTPHGPRRLQLYRERSAVEAVQQA